MLIFIWCINYTKGVKINWKTLGQGIRVTITHIFPHPTPLQSPHFGQPFATVTVTLRTLLSSRCLSHYKKVAFGSDLENSQEAWRFANWPPDRVMTPFLLSQATINHTATSSLSRGWGANRRRKNCNLTAAESILLQLFGLKICVGGGGGREDKSTTNWLNIDLYSGDK